MLFKKSPEQQIDAAMQKAKQYFQKKQFAKATAQLEKVFKMGQEQSETLSLIIELLNKYSEHWEQEEFTLSMECSMQLQEIENPNLKSVHATFSVEYQNVFKLAERLFLASNETLERQLSQEITKYGNHAIFPLINFILSLKRINTHET